MMLNIMENFPLSSYKHNSAAALHTMIESKKLAYADMLRFVADERFAKPPCGKCSTRNTLSSARSSSIQPKRIASLMPGTPPAAGDETIYLSVVDKDGNMVSLIQSNYENFGSGVVPEGAGFALQNRGALFTLDQQHPNALAQISAALHTDHPGVHVKSDIKIAFGLWGDGTRRQAHAQFVANVVDFGMNIQSALEAARFRKSAFEGCDSSSNPASCFRACTT